MIAFALVISITLAISNYIELKRNTFTNEERIVEEKANLLIYALDTSEKANFYIGENVTARMHSIMESLQELYSVSPSIEDWKFEELRERYEVDLFLIDEQNTIRYSNVEKDIGLNFDKCCGKLAKVLDDRRASGEFFADGFDVEQATGNIKKYSYMSTPDKKYIIQLGFDWNKHSTFEQFNFLSTIEQLIASHHSILDINVLNIGGLSLGKSESAYTLGNSQRAAFEHTLATGESTKLDSDWNGMEAIYMYVHYESAYDSGTTKSKVLEIIYNKEDLNRTLAKHTQAFISQIIIILFVTILLAMLISKWVAKPVYMAFHDSLTTLGNRAYFEEFVEKKLRTAQAPIVLLMIDLDNFKQVNDTLGHDDGDKLLQRTAYLMKQTVVDGEMIFRLGGDEFIIVLPNGSRSRAEQLANELLIRFDHDIASDYTLQAVLSLSIGISVAPEDGLDIETLTKKADFALYQSKKAGKNRYYVHSISD